MLYGESIRLEQLIIDLLNKENGLTDQEITEKLSHNGIAIYTVGNLCRQLAYKGKIKRVRHSDKEMTNHVI